MAHSAGSTDTHARLQEHPLRSAASADAAWVSTQRQQASTAQGRKSRPQQQQSTSPHSTKEKQDQDNLLTDWRPGPRTDTDRPPAPSQERTREDSQPRGQKPLRQIPASDQSSTTGQPQHSRELQQQRPTRPMPTPAQPWHRGVPRRHAPQAPRQQQNAANAAACPGSPKRADRQRPLHAPAGRTACSSALTLDDQARVGQQRVLLRAPCCVAGDGPTAGRTAWSAAFAPARNPGAGVPLVSVGAHNRKFSWTRSARSTRTKALLSLSQAHAQAAIRTDSPPGALSRAIY
ncbi:hypothetical protein PAPHI01_0926 [Pancytospora philotis]|nr:hypothetical protein PAPHI01_0926 [Pancytospora philotis]